MKKLLFILVAGIYLQAAQSNTDKIKQFIITSYQNHYIDFSLKPVYVDIIPILHINLDEVEILNIKMGKNALWQKNGIIITTIKKQNNQITLPISYTFEATLEVLKSSTLIKTAQKISSLNAKKETIPMQNFKSSPVSPNQLGEISAKSLISTNTIITSDKIQSQILVKKGEMINGILTQDKIQIQIPLQALENGAKDQIIKATNPESKKVLRVKIVDNNLGKIL